MHKHPCPKCEQTFVCKAGVNCFDPDKTYTCDDCFLRHDLKIWVLAIVVGLVLIGLMLWGFNPIRPK